MKNALILAASLAFVPLSYGGWLTDYPGALAQAQRENKAILVDFTGSDWCGWCIKLQKEVFAQPEFQSFAQRNLILLEVDFPRSKAQTAAQKSANQELSKRFGIRGYPTVVLLDPQGNEIARTGYRPGGARPFIGEISKMIGVPIPTRSTTPRRSKNPSQGSQPLYGVAPLQPPPKYNDLQLKGISGKPNRRFALINNHTFMQDETAGVKFEDGLIKVRCVEIKKESVIIEVGKQKERREIFLNKTH